MKRDSLWKICLTFWCFRSGIWMMAIGFFMVFIPGPTIIFGGVLMLSGVHLMLGSIAFAIQAIRSPVCRVGALLYGGTRRRKNPASLLLGFPLPKLSKRSQCSDNASQGAQVSETWIIEETGQLWKIYAAFLLFVVGFWMMTISLIGLVRFLSFSILGGVLALAGMHFMIGSVVFAVLAVRCPFCRARWLRRDSLQTDMSGTDLLTSLLTFSKCPQCGK